MWQNKLSSAFLALAIASGVFGQSTSSSNGLNEFIGGVNSVVGIISSASASASAAATSSSSASSSSPPATQSSPTSSPSAAAAAAAPHHGSNHRTLIIAVVCAVVGAILLALICLGICCCLMRRRRRQRKNRAVTPVGDDEIHSWKSEKPQNPGRTYIPSQYGRIHSGEHEPMVPPMAAGGKVADPAIDTHPAHRPENPFVPVLPSPRRSAPNSRSGLTDGTVPGDVAYIGAAGDPEKRRLRSRSRSHSRSRPSTGTGVGSNGLPTHANADRPATPFGLTGLGQPYAGTDQRNSGAGQPYGGIGQPYEDMHVHILQHDAPSQALRQSLNDRDPLASAQLRTPTPGYRTPPDVPNRSPRRSGQFTDSPYTTASDTASSSTASDEYRASYAPGISIPPGDQQSYGSHSPYSHRLNYDPQFAAQKMQQPQQNITLPHSQSASWTAPNDHYSTSPTTMAPPPVPWSEPTENRRQSPTRASGQWSESGRRASRSPATSINGQPRRLRFSDLQASPTGYGGWDERYGTSSQARSGVGEAM